jgi:LuxR family transcriptional regulator, maltose regulon positive regulatory protein
MKGAREVCEQSLGSSDDPSVQQVVMTGVLAWAACVQGQLTEAEHLAARALASAASMGLAGHPIMVDALRAQGRVAFERGDLAAAERLLEQSISISEDMRPAFAMVSQLSLSRVWLADGQAGDALGAVTRARAFLPPDSASPLLGLCDALEGRVALAIGDLERAEGCAQRLAPGHRATILQTRIGIARGKFDQAGEALARCVPVTMREHLDVTVLAARIACGRRSDDAGTLLTAAIEAAKVEGFVTAVADDLADVRSRVARLLRSRHIGTYEQAVLDRLEGHLPLVKGYGGDAGPLSDRELTVARYLASRLTTRDIATEIFVSTNTVKTHVKRIYQKLGVSSRMEAVAEARRLGLL